VKSLIPEIAPSELSAILRCANFTLTGIERQWAQISAIKYLNAASIEGKIVERGGAVARETWTSIAAIGRPLGIRIDQMAQLIANGFVNSKAGFQFDSLSRTYLKRAQKALTRDRNIVIGFEIAHPVRRDSHILDGIARKCRKRIDP
jgi:hypothetical protein